MNDENKDAVSPSRPLIGCAVRDLPMPFYQDDFVTIYNADCRDVLPQLSKVDLVITSPPYNLGNTPHNRKHNFVSKNAFWKQAKLADGYDTYTDDLPREEYVKFQKTVLQQCWDLLDEQGAIFYNHKPRVMNGVLQTPLELNPNLPLRQIVIWDRGNGINYSKGHFLPCHEWILIFAKPDFQLSSRATSGIGDVWRIAFEVNTEHPAPFPLELAKRAIVTTNAQTILDPFCGSGTTLKAAKDLGLRAIGIEVSTKYCEIAVKRLKQSPLPLREAV